MLEFTYNRENTRWEAQPAPNVRYFVYNNAWVNAARQDLRNGVWVTTYQGPKNTWLASQPAKDWANNVHGLIGVPL